MPDTCYLCGYNHAHWISCERYAAERNLRDVPAVTNDQLRHIWGWLCGCPGERPLAPALEQALASARREYPPSPAYEPEPYRIEDTCCGKCVGGMCYVDQITGA